MKAYTILILATLLFCPTAHGEEVFRYFEIDPSPKFWGLASDFDLGLRILDGVDTVVWGRTHLVYDNLGYFLDPQESTLNSSIEEDASLLSIKSYFNAWNFKAALGIKQGLSFDTAKDRNNANLLLAYLFEYISPPDTADQSLLLVESNDSFRTGGMYGRILLDLAFDGTKVDPISKNVAGLFLEAYAEFSPSLNTQDQAWFRFGGLAKAYLPLFEHKDYGPNSKELLSNVLSSYLGFQAVYDYVRNVSDARLPYLVYGSIGGFDERSGLGGLIRGLGDGYLPGLQKFAINIDWYLSGPTLFGLDLVPGMVVYADWGLSSDYQGNLKDALSLGLGLTLNFFDYTHGVIYLQFLPFQPAFSGQHGPLIGFDIGLHF